jgi:glycosyltransferase involved in cell wall biosynthesis
MTVQTPLLGTPVIEAGATPPRILYIITTLQISGPSLQVILLASTMREAGYETVLLTGKTPVDNFQSLATHYDIEPMVISELWRSYNPIQHIKAFFALYRTIKHCAPDIVHTHTTTAGFLGRLAARLAGVPVIVHTLHVHPFYGQTTHFNTFIFMLAERLASIVSHNVITLSEKLRRELTDTYRIVPRPWLTVLPVGYDLEIFARTRRYSGVFRKAFKLPREAPLVGIVGRLMPVKNHALFLEAAASVKKAMPDAHFVIVGDGELHQALQEQADQLGLSDCITFTGWMQEMTNVYSDLDVLVISSHSEGTPVPIIEALAAGCPVVATNVGGVSDLLAWTGCEMVRPGDAPALAEAIQRTLERGHSPEPARTMMMDRYHIGRLAQDLDGLYKGLLGRYARRKK